MPKACAAVEVRTRRGHGKSDAIGPKADRLQFNVDRLSTLERLSSHLQTRRADRKEIGPGKLGRTLSRPIERGP